MKFQNVQVGDEVMLLKTLAVYVGSWAKKPKFLRYFYLKVKVTKVTKTQFTVGGSLRFSKDGCGYGDNHLGAYTVGGEFEVNLVIPTECQLAEYKEYEVLINVLQPYANTPAEYNPINAETMDKAIEALYLLKDLVRVIGYQKEVK